MSTTANGKARASVPHILADLLMVGQLERLPDMTEMNAAGNRIVGIAFATLADLRAWLAVLGTKYEATSQTYHEKSTLHTAYATDRLGWSIRLSALVPIEAGHHTELDVGYLINLDAIVSNGASADLFAEDMAS